MGAVVWGAQKGQTPKGYFWVCHSPKQKVVGFNYSKGRSAQFPTEFLKDYHGYIQTEGYGVYDAFEQKNGITLLGCMAHARRYFVEASGNDKQRSEYFIAQLQCLYHIEEGLRQSNGSSEEILAKR